VAVGLHGLRLVGVPPQDLMAALVFAGAAPDVTDVMVGGRFVVRHGRHVTIDVARELEAALR
jgi:cytosine/adenosine deaminase-related metal-dependent hydrolase